MPNPELPVAIIGAVYGKTGLRIVSWGADGRPIRDLELSILVEGAFLASYEAGDNSAVLPSDTLRRHALAEATAQPELPIDGLLERIAQRILTSNPAFSAVECVAQSRIWEPRAAHSHVLAAGRGTARIRLRRGGEVVRSGGLEDLTVLLTTGSAFAGFFRDDMTTQNESFDRPLCGVLAAEWTCRDGPIGGASYPKVAELLLDAFTDRPSGSVQHLLTEIAAETLRNVDEIATLTLRFRSIAVQEVGPDLGGGSIPNTVELLSAAAGVTEVTAGPSINAD